jgi:C-terminal processing protease CtpA/Prc
VFLRAQQCFRGERVGVIRLTSFNARALRGVSAALDKLQEQGATELVLDLRDNMAVWGLGQAILVRFGVSY